jgi:hypothetical protein
MGDDLRRLRTFEYTGVRLRESRWWDQYQRARDFYASLAEDDVLYEMRKAAGQDAPGRSLGGWVATKDHAVAFGQWLSAMARMARGTG